jgi:hypothetical protein
LTHNVGTREKSSFAAQWLAYTTPYRRFAGALFEKPDSVHSGVEAVRKLLRTGLGKAIGALDRALEAGQHGRRPAEQQLLAMVRDQIIGVG